MKAIINVGLVGYGFASKTFHAPLIQATAGLDLVAVSSSDAAKVKADLPNVEIESQALALCKRPDLDLIVKATPYLLRSFLNSKHKAVRQNLKPSERRPNIYEDAYMYLFT